jgi:hypothetical protein
LYGAEFTQVYANRLGERIVPAPDAQVVNPHKAAAGQADENVMRGRNPGRAA